MSVDDLMKKILAILPNATVDEDLEGQIVIYTNKKERDGSLVEFDTKD